MAGAPHTDTDRYYAALGMQPGTPLRQVKSKARALFMQFHPDLNPNNREYCEEKIKGIIQAYKIILDIRKNEAEPAAEKDAPETGQSDPALEVLLFELSNRLLAVPTRHVREIIRVADVRIDEAGIMYDAFPFLAGVFHRGGEITMLWNLHKQFRLREPPIGSDLGKRKIVVAHIDGSALGLMVDGVPGITTLDRDAPAPDHGSVDIEPVFLDGVFHTDNGPAALIDLKSILYNMSL